MNVLSVRDVTRRFRSGVGVTVAVDSVSFDVAAGELVGLSGPSGSGKSTLLNLVTGWDEPDEGSVVHADGSPRNWSGTAIVPQGIGLLPELTALENVEIVEMLGHVDRRGRRPADVLTELGLGHVLDRAHDEMSLGEQQRVAIARAIIATPVLIVADEPTAHQDEANVDLVVELLRACADRGSAGIVASHDPRVLRSLDRVLTLTDGRLPGPSSSTGSPPSSGPR